MLRKLVFRRILGLTLLMGACSVSTSAPRIAQPEPPHSPGPRTVTPAWRFEGYQLPIFSKVLFYANNQLVRSWKWSWPVFESMVKALAREQPGMSVECQGERLVAHLGSQDWQAKAAEVDTTWAIRSKLQHLFDWLAPQLAPRDGLSTAQQLARLEFSAANGLLSAVDAHSVLLSPAQSREYVAPKPQQAGSTGMILRQVQNRICIESAIDGGPAARAGIVAGSVLERLDEDPVAGMSLYQIVGRLRGPVGSPIRLTLRRGPHSAPVSLNLVREQVSATSVYPSAQLLTSEDPISHRKVSVGYCRLRDFAVNAESGLVKAVSMFNKEGVRGIVLDLRGNAGGLFDQATKVADVFLESGVIATLVGSRETRRSEVARPGGEAVTLPVVVLVDAQSAGASEIVAGALQQRDRAVILGEKTDGNGSVQMLFSVSTPVPISAEDPDTQMYLKLTTGLYLVPHNQVIEGVGISPHVVLCAERDGQPGCKAAGPTPMVTYVARAPGQGDCGEVLLKPEEDLPVQLARDLLAGAGSTSAREMLAKGKDLFQPAPKAREAGHPRMLGR